MKIYNFRSSNFSSRKSAKKISSIIIHYTGMKSFDQAFQRLIDERSEVSSHYLISRSGKVFKLVEHKYAAWHAGISKWANFVNLNKNSIGIELENKGHQYGYQNYTNKQILSLIKLLKILKSKFNINNKNIIGHSDIAPDRKIDPGEKFPWKKLSEKNLSIWHCLNDNFLKKYRFKRIIISKKLINKLISKMAKKLGYSTVFSGKSLNKNFIKAFQRRFRQKNINGIFDQECLLILKNLNNTLNS